MYWSERVPQTERRKVKRCIMEGQLTFVLSDELVLLEKDHWNRKHVCKYMQQLGDRVDKVKVTNTSHDL